MLILTPNEVIHLCVRKGDKALSRATVFIHNSHAEVRDIITRRNEDKCRIKQLVHEGYFIVYVEHLNGDVSEVLFQYFHDTNTIGIEADDDILILRNRLYYANGDELPDWEV